MNLGTHKSRAPLALIAAALSMAIMIMLGGSPAATSAGSQAAARTGMTNVAKNVNGKMTSKIVGTASDGSTVTGSFTPLRFVKKDGKQQVRGVVDGVVTHANKVAEEILGVPVEQLQGHTVEAAFHATREDGTTLAGEGRRNLIELS